MPESLAREEAVESLAVLVVDLAVQEHPANARVSSLPFSLPIKQTDQFSAEERGEVSSSRLGERGWDARRRICLAERTRQGSA